MSWRETIVQIVTEINPALPVSDLTDDAHLTRDLGIRSLQLVELVEHIERKVGHRVRLEEVMLADSGGMLEMGRLVSWLDERVPMVRGGRE
jgi:acyl carrier protein